MGGEPRVTRSAMRTRASRGLAADFLELPATPSRTRGTTKTPGKTPRNAPTDARQPFGELVNVKVSSEENDACQTPAVRDADASALSDLERLLMSPTPRLTPETSTKAQNAQRSAEEATKHAAADEPKKPQAAVAVTAAGSAAAGAVTVQSDAEQLPLAEAAAEALSKAPAQQVAELQTAAKAAAADMAGTPPRLAAKLPDAPDVQAATQAAAAAERRAAAKVAAEAQPAAGAALMTAQLQAAKAQAAAVQAVPGDAMQLGTEELAAAPALAKAVGEAGTDRWDVDAEDDTMCDSADAVTKEQLTEKPPPASVVKSRIVPTATFEPRSIRQLKKEVKAQYAKQGISGLAEAGDDEAQGALAPCEGDAIAASLADALNGLSIGANTASGPLRGVPVAQGKHLRFDDEGSVNVGSPVKLQLRGMPQAAGKHLRFD